MKSNSRQALYNKFNELSDKNGQTWHYTTLQVLLSIFKDYIDELPLKDSDKNTNVTKCKMLASNIRYMNDIQEFKDGLEYFKSKSVGRKLGVEKIDKKIHISDITYIISFCKNGDLLSQWKWYANDSGISIKFNFNKIMTRTFANKKEKDDNSSDCSAGDTKDNRYDRNNRPVDIKYKEKEKEDWYKLLIDGGETSFKGDTDLLSCAFIPFCKNENYFEEEESRLVFFVDEENSFEIKYNNTSHGIKPCLEVSMLLKTQPKSIFIDDCIEKCATKDDCCDNIISQIIVGPGKNQNLIFNSLIHIFDRNNYRFHEENETYIYYNGLVPNDSGVIPQAICPRKIEEIEYTQKIELISCDDNKTRKAYKCKNGIIIMKSSIPFRG